MKQAMKVGDPVLFYHSNCAFERLDAGPAADAVHLQAKRLVLQLWPKLRKKGTLTVGPTVCRRPLRFLTHFATVTAFDPTHPYYDAKSSKDTPTWYMVR